jgi:hypothetical protein
VLVNYRSEKTRQSSTVQDEPRAIAQLEELRGTSEADLAVHKVISWVTRKDYESQVGISLAI